MEASARIRIKLNIKDIAEALAENIADTARWALIEEVTTTPKPGLVDAYSNGAHSDMNLMTFIDSAEALRPYFKEMALVGFTAYDEPEKVFKVIRQIGIAAESAMYKATGGVNTHKGLIFSIGILSAAAAISFCKYGRFSRNEIFAAEQEMVKEILCKELKEKSISGPLTHGEKVYKKYGAAGARGEALTGYRTVRKTALYEMDKGVSEGHNFEDVKLQTLMSLIAEVEDSNILSRSDDQTLDKVRRMAKDFLADGGVYRSGARDILKDWDRLFIKWNISPGGCADLLAIALFIYRLTGGKL